MMARGMIREGMKEQRTGNERKGTGGNRSGRRKPEERRKESTGRGRREG